MPQFRAPGNTIGGHTHRDRVEFHVDFLEGDFIPGEALGDLRFEGEIREYSSFSKLACCDR